MADIKWIKIYVDMFDHKKIKFIRKLPEGNDILLCWVMLLASAGKCNMGGHIFLTSDIPYTAEMLADEFGMPTNTVRLALETFKKLNMVNLDNGIYVEGWEEYQNIDGMEKIRLQNRERAKKHYDNKKARLLIEDSNVKPNVRLTQPNATELELELDLELEEEKDLKSNKESIAKPKTPRAPLTPKKNKFGEYGHILLTENELEKLQTTYTNTDELIKHLDEYIEMKGTKYKSHYLAILKWVVNAVEEQKTKSRSTKATTSGNMFTELRKEMGF